MTMDFNQRLQKAIERGHRTGEAKAAAQRRRELNEEELKRLHLELRLPLSEHIENCLRQLPNHFPGFEYQTVMDERGWGGTANRDDLHVAGGRRRNLFSRLEMVIRPYSSLHVLELAAKGTVRNKELFNRTHFQQLVDADDTTFMEMIDLWALEYAELYAAKS